ncbi:thiamine-phosphate synthase [Candidatus Kuenenia stuttgartiensis]|jgi:thiamine-phosphate pyrophosphorylase|uniref:Thiamine-phosphate synthase n=1 Tax=Kuenenia stuttgartiensis TaxID=174633 RepID=Q1PZK7_KUEST|nr:thiamine phosphate synthase [Candidatus Kuenenia stuttgartiensis]MBE7546696.1 thiamine phosphate synthase [Planctomycetia bacterium]MBW7940899.1 thiamine phosphate synthase [Candidatus Kuenenia stuttgartiensis]MBZ0190317.1 thiamine phosphate synthase [Candidatus Kuenenia stuttgartiensis]MCF6150947.1 thiamine phosphate synthase [Candidatus Kuenenia stuttgartiensis]MCL4725906.1 thiamine phosphate synthase [Candidatus Kuenenia stuttgartiensis]
MPLQRKQSAYSPAFVLITDRKQSRLPLINAVKLALKGGVNTIQLREKDLPTKDIYSLACELRTITHGLNASLIINDRVDIVLAANADGVHLGWQSMPVSRVRNLIGFERIIGISAHNMQEALQARDSGADYITYGPIFKTPSKEGVVEPTGTESLRKLKEKIRIPVIALGGITVDNAESVMESGANGIAVVSSILKSDNPENTALRLYSIIQHHSKMSG